MKHTKIISSIIATGITALTIAGIAVASEPQQDIANAVDLKGQGTLSVDSLRVGDTTSGGVTFFNGTVVNEGGAFVVGDHFRVDGNIHRGPEHGINKGDNKPLRFNDEVVSMGAHTFEQGFNFSGGVADFQNVEVKNFPVSEVADHNHDSRYFTESETTALLANKADTNHTHDDRYYTESEVDTRLSTKADSSDVATNTSNIATNTSNIASNTSDISGNTSNISTNTTNINGNTAQIATLDTEVIKETDTTTRYVVIGPNDMAPRTDSITPIQRDDGFDSFLLGANTQFYAADFYVPELADIQDVTTYTSGGNLTARLKQTNMDSQSTTDIFSETTGGGTEIFSTGLPLTADVNDRFSLDLEFTGAGNFYGAKIRYTIQQQYD